ncbi:hypothetical protein IQ264_09160 [Phormidium sp. LEGE 05292]|uniref:hypothetical protein n=1 Tax=[Phormidium] sp. LEGE 05292 TaxID=767427 RepID=UPI00187F85B1|nr:hypothetical protein [Phormidium sp. LEGE 05292]MBE9225588.1 hypothetical protein [Phormidium sp. LEGE 05292]
MEAIESLLFGIEPITAIAVGIGAILLAPIIGTVSSMVNKQDEESAAESTENPVTQTVSSAGETARDFAKDAMVWGMDVVESIQTTFAEASESFQDFVAEAKADYEIKKSERQAADTTTQPRTIEVEGN